MSTRSVRVLPVHHSAAIPCQSFSMATFPCVTTVSVRREVDLVTVAALLLAGLLKLHRATVL